MTRRQPIDYARAFIAQRMRRCFVCSMDHLPIDSDEQELEAFARFILEDDPHGSGLTVTSVTATGTATATPADRAELSTL